MGRGDKKTAKGKRAMGSYGISRKRNDEKKIEVTVKKEKPVKETKSAEVKTEKKAASKAAPKKTTTKKTKE
jgi:ribosomal small subunit protein bTHX